MAIPHVEAGSVALAAEQNALIDQSNDTASKAESNQGRIDTAENNIASNNQDIANLDSRTTTLENAQVVASDLALYGDRVSSARRADSWYTETTGNGFMTAFATIARKTFTATELRMCLTQDAGGASGETFDIGFYTGSSLTALNQQWAAFGPAGNTDTLGIVTWTLPDVFIAQGAFIAVEIICTNYDTVPGWSSTPSGTNADLLINSTPYSVYESGRSYPLDDPIDMTAGTWTRSNQLFWFAIA